MDNGIIVHIQDDALISIFHFLIFDLGHFDMFSKLLMAWLTRGNMSRVKHLLERLNWDALYQFHNHQFEVTRDQFHDFISFAVRFNVDQAMFYNSVRSLFRMVNVQHHLSVLSNLSGTHFPSKFAFVFFKAIYRPFERNQTVEEMSELLNNTYLRGRLLEQISLLQDIYENLFERDYLLPVYKFCPNARNMDPIYQIDGPPFEEELWYSLCEKTVEEEYRDAENVYGKMLRMQHIWASDCQHCRLQLILFKVLLGSVRN